MNPRWIAIQKPSAWPAPLIVLFRGNGASPDALVPLGHCSRYPSHYRPAILGGAVQVGDRQDPKHTLSLSSRSELSEVPHCRDLNGCSH
jgi:hypothetical protein